MLLIFLFLFWKILHYTNGQGQSIEAAFHELPGELAINYFKWKQSTRLRKFNVSNIQLSGNADGTAGRLHLNGTARFLIGNITIGTPPQTFRMSFELDGTEMYVLNSNTYNSGEDSSDDGYVNPNYVGGVFVNLTFGMADSIPEVFQSLPVDGEFGISKYGMSEENNILSPLYEMEKTLKNPVVSFALKNSSPKVTFGAHDRTNCEKTWSYVPATESKEYAIEVLTVGIGTKTRVINAEGFIDYHGDRMDMGKDEADFLADILNASYDSKNERYTLPCNSTNAKDIQIVVGKNKMTTTLTIKPEHYILKPEIAPNLCELGFIGFGDTNTTYNWFLGSPFMNAQCFLLHLKTRHIGLFLQKKSIVGKKKSNVERVNSLLCHEMNNCPEAQTNNVKNYRYQCCCAKIHIKKATYVVAYVSAFLIVSNLLMKLAGYSETAWDWELLFLIVDGIAVLSLIYGISTERAAFLQPFVVLSIVTASFLILLATYLGSAIYNQNSYAGQDLELELHKRLSDAAHKLSLEFKYMVTIFATIAFFGILISIIIHCWFIYLTVQCAKHFRDLEQKG